MSKLTDKNYWDHFHEEICVPKTAAVERTDKSLARRLLGKRLYSYRSSYTEYRLYEVILKKFLPRQPGLKVVELGSAPGGYLVELHRRFGYDPYGIEYSEVGVANNRKTFVANGIDPEQVICGDVTSPEIQRDWREAFDIVFSLSFIEHFSDPDRMIDAHLGLLKKNGMLVIVAPNLNGLNKRIYGFFNSADLAAHNLAITNLAAFRDLFSEVPVEPLFCGLYGTFSFQMYKILPGAKRTLLLKIGKQMQQGINILYRLVLRDRGWESNSLSPFMVFIGRKQ
ncbi:MAG: methyltransferase domain-containing protein [bacterium]|nr:methyltransferase domain-containing protein [bacterium]